MSKYQNEQLVLLGELWTQNPTYLNTAYAGSRITSNSIVGILHMDNSSKEEYLSELSVPSSLENSGFESEKRCSKILSGSPQEQQDAQQQQLLLWPPSLQPLSLLPQDAEKHDIYGDKNCKISEYFGYENKSFISMELGQRLW